MPLSAKPDFTASSAEINLSRPLGDFCENANNYISLFSRLLSIKRETSPKVTRASRIDSADPGDPILAASEIQNLPDAASA